ncbi:PAS domain S-box protein [Paenisporosarcina sp. TG20]|uniref:PAS domain S-box protein n=1 Tax=Paenisporosarcina sp. TG20 TaxID=1211706 RepID=UPI0002ED249B|nr:PAS domain S-box protein [Paenisporosarcina sp. TG20]
MEKIPEVPNVTILEKENMYRQIVEYSFETTIIHSNQKVLYINQSGSEFFKATKEQIIGANVVEVFADESKDIIIERIRKATEENEIGNLIEAKIYRFDGTPVEVELYCHPVQFGEKKAIQSIMRDITTRKDSERKLNKVINEIGTPIVPVSEGIAVLPLVGTIGEDRVIQLMEIIPQKALEHNLNYLIIDFSGIYNIDSVVIEFLYKINSILNLLGIAPICTGIRPELALKAIENYGDLSTLNTMSTVQQALSQLTK